MSDLKINRGVELMLRGGAKKDPERKGITIKKILSLFNYKFHFGLELTVEKENK
jgi:hypothetical protein